MGHLSIAVIKKIASYNSLGEPVYNFLIIKKGEEFRFYDAKSLAIGSSFNFSGFQKHIIDALSLPESNFEKITPLRTSRKDDATAYEYVLSPKQAEYVDENIIKGEGIYSSISWLTETDLIASKNNWKASQAFIFEVEKPFTKSTFSKSLRTSIKNIVKARANGKLVIFAGAGVSMDSNVPDWGKLIADLKTDIECGDVDYLQVGELYCQQRGNKEYQERVREILNVGKTIYNPIHKKILEIQPIHIITTNFDSHFEQIIESKNFHYSVIKKDTDLPYSKGNSLLIKMHGDFFEKNIVLKHSDYTDYSKNFPLIESYIKGLFSSKLVLFIGFSFTDPNLAYILESVKDLLGNDNQSPYLFQSSIDNVPAHQRKLIEDKVRIIDYEDSAITEHFEQVSTPEDKDNLNSLSTRGGNTYKFLKVVENFDLVADTLENLEIQDQLKHSLERFKGLSSIPPTCFEYLSPFTLKKKSVFDFSNKAVYSSAYSFHLEVLNEELLNFLESRKENDEIHFLAYRDKNQEQSKAHLDQIFKFLYTSGVQCVIRKSDTSPNHNKLIPKNSDQSCSCFRCLYGDFKLGILLEDLDSAADKLICKNDNDGVSLLEAYGFFKTAQPTKAFYALEKLKNEAWKTQNYAVYFIACYNQQLLLPFLFWYYDSRIKQEEFEQIKLRIKQTNIDKLLFDLPVDNEVKAVLKFIADNKIYELSEQVMEENLAKVREVYKGYSSETGYYQSFGATYWHIIETEFYILNNFYRSNFMYNDEYDYYKKIAHLYIEGIIASIATSAKYPQHIRHCSRFFFDSFISHGNPEDNEKLLFQYKISEFEFSSTRQNRPHILKMLNNYLDAGYVEQNFLGESINKNEFLDAALNRSNHMQKKVKDLFDNFMILLIRINLEESELNLLIKRILNYLQVSNAFGGHKAYQFFEKLIVHYISKIDDQNILKIIEFILADEVWSDSLVKKISSALIKAEKIEFLDEKIYTQIIRRTEFRQKYNVRIQDMIPLYQLLKIEQQASFRLCLIEQLLKGKLNTDHIRKAYYCKIWIPTEKDPFYEYFCEQVKESIARIPECEVSNTGTPIGLTGFIDANDAIFAVTLIYSNNLQETDFCTQLKENAVSNSFKWVLSPETFDYENFDIKWLLLFSKKTTISKMKSNNKLQQAIVNGLKTKFNQEVANIYFEHFCTVN